MQKYTLYLDEQAKQDAALIQKRFGLRSLAAAVRFALRVLAERVEREGVVGSRPHEGDVTDHTPRD